MLKIMIIANAVANSSVALNDEDRGIIADLPAKLRNKVLNEVEELSKRDVSNIEYKEKHFVLTHNDKNYVVVPSPDFLKGISVTLLVETIQLLQWYLRPHTKGSFPGALGGTIKCCDCGIVQRRGRCEFTGCPSHAKWAEIIEGYVVPTCFNDGELSRIIQKLQDNKQDVAQSIPTNEQNEWIQKG